MFHLSIISSIHSILSRRRRRIRNVISRYPKLYLPMARVASRAKGLSSPPKGLHDRVVTPDTEIVIEGFPRCGNSFAEAAFRLAQPRHVRCAHHCHASAQVIAAVRWNIPTIVLFRDPDEAVTSLLMRDPHTYSADDAYSEYINFYDTILPIKKGYVLSSFKCTTQSFDKLIRKVNKRFGSHFLEIEHSSEMVTQAFKMVDEFTQYRSGRKKTDYSIFQNMDDQRLREEKKANVRMQLMNAKITVTRAKAQDLFKLLCKKADC